MSTHMYSQRVLNKVHNTEYYISICHNWVTILYNLKYFTS